MGSRKQQWPEGQQISEKRDRGASRHGRAGQILQALTDACKECGFYSKVPEFLN